MYGVTLPQADNLPEFRSLARRLLAVSARPGDVCWGSGAPGLFVDVPPDRARIISVPASFAALAALVICHRNEERWPLLYEALWRIDQGDRTLMQRRSDPLIHRLCGMAAEVRRDRHQMTAFVRFRAVGDGEGERYLAWYEPRHFVVRLTADFFIDRFANMRFSILTPDLTLHWDRTDKRFAPGLRRENAASDDAVEDWWRRYYAAIFNPARVNRQLMQGHMPKRFWRDLPEAQLIAGLIREAGSRTDRMIRSGTDVSLSN